MAGTIFIKFYQFVVLLFLNESLYVMFPIK